MVKEQTKNNGNAFTSTNIRYKTRLNVILDKAYENHPKLQQFKAFRVECTADEPKSFLGKYHEADDEKYPVAVIVLAWIERLDPAQVMVTALHELSHHIETVEYKKTGHDDKFYEIHKTLLFAAFDLGILSPADITSAELSVARNNNKLAKIISDYKPSGEAVKKNENAYEVIVFDGYEHKELLKDRGYRYNSIDKAWLLKGFSSSDKADEELEKIISLGVNKANAKVRVAHGVPGMDTALIAIAVGSSAADDVKKLGYVWNADKLEWQKRIKRENIAFEVERTAPIARKYSTAKYSVNGYRFVWNIDGTLLVYDTKLRRDIIMSVNDYVEKYFEQIDAARANTSVPAKLCIVGLRTDKAYTSLLRLATKETKFEWHNDMRVVNENTRVNCSADVTFKEIPSAVNSLVEIDKSEILSPNVLLYLYGPDSSWSMILHFHGKGDGLLSGSITKGGTTVKCSGTMEQIIQILLSPLQWNN